MQLALDRTVMNEDGRIRLEKRSRRGIVARIGGSATEAVRTVFDMEKQEQCKTEHPAERSGFLSERMRYIFNGCELAEISGLQVLWPGTSMRYICNGCELCPNRTFDDYEIHEGGAIVALPAGDGFDVSRRNAWVAATREDQDFNQSLQWMLDSRTSPEVARLRDLQIWRREVRSRRRRKTGGSTAQMTCTLQATQATNTEYEIGCEPATEALPATWN
jgi:hypothetical protein